VSDFGLIDAIESGLVKIPQLAIRDTSGKEHAEYLNLWQWILPVPPKNPMHAFGFAESWKTDPYI